MLRNIPWKVVKSVRIGGGRALLVRRRYRGKYVSNIPRNRTQYAVTWEGNHTEGFPALISGGWSGDKKKCEELFEEIRKRAQVFLRQIREWQDNTHGTTFLELERNHQAQEGLFLLLSDASLEMQRGEFSLTDLGEVGIVKQ